MSGGDKFTFTGEGQLISLTLPLRQIERHQINETLTYN